MGQPSVLIIYAHPDSKNSVANQQLLQAVDGLTHVRVHDLYACYPDFFIDVHAEQQLLAEHTVIVFQHPLYTYSCPALLKEWFDRVLTRGFASGEGGNALVDKYWRSVITTGEPENLYQTEHPNPYQIDDILKPLALTAKMCQMQWVPPFIAYWARRQSTAKFAEWQQAYRDWLCQPSLLIE